MSLNRVFILILIALVLLLAIATLLKNTKLGPDLYEVMIPRNGDRSFSNSFECPPNNAFGFLIRVPSNINSTISGHALISRSDTKQTNVYSIVVGPLLSGKDQKTCSRRDNEASERYLYSVKGIDQVFVKNGTSSNIDFKCELSFDSKMEDAEVWYSFYAMPSDVKNCGHILQGQFGKIGVCQGHSELGVEGTRVSP